MRRSVPLVAAGALLASVGYGGMTWWRYGRADSSGVRDALLDRFMPTYEVREYHRVGVRAPAGETFAAARSLELHRSPVIRAIFRGRELLMRSGGPPAVRHQPFLDEALSLGWRILAEEPGREIVVGAVTQPWKADVVFRGVPAEEFATFAEPGYAKIVWNLAVAPDGTGRSVFSTETRVATTDPTARRKFRRYWIALSLGIRAIRWETIRLVKRAAEAA